MAERGGKAIFYILLAIVVLGVVGTIPGRTWLNGVMVGFFGTSQPAPAPAPAGTQPASVTPFCDTTQGETLTNGPTLEKFAPGTSTSAEYHRLFVTQTTTDGMGPDQGLFAEASTKTINPNDKITIFYGENSSVYYAAKQQFIAPCTAAVSSSDSAYDKTGKAQLFRMDGSASLNIKCINDDNGLINEGLGGTGGNESFTTSDDINIPCSIQGTANRGYSPYGGVLLTYVYNNTAYTKVEATSDTSGWSVTTFNTPTFVTNANVTTGFTSATFHFKKAGTLGEDLVGLISNEKLSFTTRVEVTDTSASEPTQGGGGDIKMLLSDLDWYKHATSGEMLFGAENDANTNVGQTIPQGATFRAQ